MLSMLMVGFQSKSFDTIKDGILAKERKNVEWTRDWSGDLSWMLGNIADYVA